jgi:hypothetical protein
MHAYTYREYDGGDGGLHQLLQEHGFDDVALGHQVFAVLDPGMKPVLVHGPTKSHVHARVHPVHNDGHEDGQHFIRKELHRSDSDPTSIARGNGNKSYRVNLHVVTKHCCL